MLKLVEISSVTQLDAVCKMNTLSYPYQQSMADRHKSYMDYTRVDLGPLQCKADD
jgi:hypothetical protein